MDDFRRGPVVGQEPVLYSEMVRWGERIENGARYSLADGRMRLVVDDEQTRGAAECWRRGQEMRLTNSREQGLMIRDGAGSGASVVIDEKHPVDLMLETCLEERQTTQ